MPIAKHRDNGIAVTESQTAESQTRVLWSRVAGGRPSQPLGQRWLSQLLQTGAFLAPANPLDSPRFRA